jgi:hypothetical protein
MSTPRTGRPFRKPHKDEIRFQPQGYILGYADGFMLLGAKSKRAALMRAIREVEGPLRVSIENRYKTLLQLSKSRRPCEESWFRWVGRAVKIAYGCEAREECINDLGELVKLVDTAAETKLPFSLGQGRRVGQLNNEPGWLMRKLELIMLRKHQC